MSKAMSVRNLDSSIFWAICHYLAVPDVLRLSLGCRTFKQLLTNGFADMAVWRLYAHQLLGQLFPKGKPAPSRELSDWNVSSYRRLVQILYQYGSYLGNWRWDVPVRGGLLIVGMDLDEKPYSRMVADLVIPNQCSTLAIQNVTELHTANLFELHFNDDNCILDLDDVKITEVNETTMQVSGEAALYVAESCQENFIVMGAARDSPLQILSDYFQSMAIAPMKFHRLLDTSIDSPTPAPKDGDFDLTSILGVYEGVFGPHGLELIHISLSEDGQLLGLKVTGDPNVPAGQLCFRSVGPFEAPDVSCSCQYGCGCWRPDRDAVRGWELSGMFRIEAQTAMHGYQNPQWNTGKLMVCSQRSAHGSTDCYTATDLAAMDLFLIVVWDGLFSTRLAQLQE